MTPTFASFAKTLGVKMTLGQRVLTGVAFDGANPCDLGDTERAVARRIFGELDIVRTRDVFAAVCGARGGKTYLIGALRLLHLALTVDVSTLAPGERAAAIAVGPDIRLARQLLRYALGAAKSVPAISRLVTEDREDSFVIRREGGRSVVIECLPATRGGSAVRGRSLVGACLDEGAFFRDSDFVVNDTEIFRALAPRILPGGQLIVASTPWAETGLLYELYRDNFGHPATALVAHAPTTLLRPDARTAGIVERERQRDADNARREFDAQFMTGGSGLFLDASAVDACVDENLILPASPSGRVYSGADFGFRSDSSALSVVDRAGSDVRLIALEEERPKKGAPLRPSAVASTFAALASALGCRSVMSDSHYAESIREHLRAQNMALSMAPEGQNGKTATYLCLRELVHAKRLRLPVHPRLIAQLKALTSRPTSGGGLLITSPRRAGGGHGDLVSALVLALWQASREPTKREGRRFIGSFGGSWNSESRTVDGRHAGVCEGMKLMYSDGSTEDMVPRRPQ